MTSRGREAEASVSIVPDTAAGRKDRITAPTKHYTVHGTVPAQFMDANYHEGAQHSCAFRLEA
jgi:hypothetical protein